MRRSLFKPRHVNLGDTVMTPDGGSLLLRSKNEALHYQQNPADFLELHRDRIVPPAKVLPEPKIYLRSKRLSAPERSAAKRTRAMLDLASGGRLDPRLPESDPEPERRSQFTKDPETGEVMVELHTLDDIITDPAQLRARAANAKHKAELLKKGGKRITANMRPDAAKALARLMKKLGSNATDTIELALIETAKRRCT